MKFIRDNVQFSIIGRMKFIRDNVQFSIIGRMKFIRDNVQFSIIERMKFIRDNVLTIITWKNINQPESSLSLSRVEVVERAFCDI